MIIVFEEIASTNQFAKEHHTSLPDATIIWAKHQVAGYGKPGNRWFSRPNQALLFTLVYKYSPQEIAAFDSNVASFNTACFLIKHLHSITNVKAGIKVPNDIYTSRGKLGGILIERVDNSIIVGVGLNLRRIDVYGSTSIEDEGNIFNLFDFIIELSSHLLDLKTSLCGGKVVADAQKYFMFIGEKIRATVDGREIEGIFKGVTDTGDIIIGDAPYKWVTEFRPV